MKPLKLFGKILAIALAVVLGLAVLVIGGLNVAKFAIYSDYYAIKTDICINPGLSDGFVCQGICALEETGKILVSGYMKDGVSASRIYVTDEENNSYYVSVLVNGEDYVGHGSGIAYYGDNAYLVSEGKIHVIALNDIFNAKRLHFA